MFIIATKFSQKYNHIIQLVDDIRKFHKEEKILIVDSFSEDRSYYPIVSQYNNVEIIDTDYVNSYHVGSFITGLNKYPNEEFYYLLHDSSRVLEQIDWMKEHDATCLCYFHRHAHPAFSSWSNRVNLETKWRWNDSKDKLGVAYGMIMAKKWVFDKFREAGLFNLIPTCKFDGGICEGVWGFALEQVGLSPKDIALYGDILGNESPAGIAGPYPHNNSYQKSIMKIYCHISGRN